MMLQSTGAGAGAKMACRALPPAALLAAAAWSAAAAQSQTPTLMDWIRGRQAPPPTAQAPAPGTMPIPGTQPPATPPAPTIRDGRYYVRGDFTVRLRTDLDEKQCSC